MNTGIPFFRMECYVSGQMTSVPGESGRYIHVLVDPLQVVPVGIGAISSLLYIVHYVYIHTYNTCSYNKQGVFCNGRQNGIFIICWGKGYSEYKVIQTH